MHATSLPTDLAVAALAAAVLLALGLPCTALAARWMRPVTGEVARPFSYTRAAPFERGAHRGVDLVAAPGTRVRAACTGTVIHAGAVARIGGVVSMRCGARRVSYLPLSRVAVRAGERIAAGTALGAVAHGHGGLHLGVRAEADRFGYEDPLPLLASPPTAPRTPLVPVVRPSGRAPRPVAEPRPVIAPRASGRAPRPVAEPRPVIAPRRVPAPRFAPSPSARPTGAPPGGVAPPTVWAGLGLLLAGAAGSRTVALRRRRAARRPLAAPDAVRQAA